MSVKDDDIIAPPPPPEGEAPKEVESAKEEKRGKDEKKSDRHHRRKDKKDDRDRGDRDRKSSRRSRSRSRSRGDRKSSRRSRSRSRDRGDRDRDRDRERDRRRSRSRDRERERERERRRSRSRSRDRARRASPAGAAAAGGLGGGYQPRRSVHPTGPTTFPSAAAASQSGNPAGHSVDYFKDMRSAGPVVTVDPLTHYRKMAEGQLEAKLNQARARATASRDMRNKTQRKVYIGNVSPQMTTEFIRQLFSQTLLISYPEWNVPGQDIIVDVQHKEGAKYAFVEFKAIEQAHAALQINGVSVLNTTLLVTRPQGFIDPADCDRMVEEAEKQLAAFRRGEDETPLFELAKTNPALAPLLAIKYGAAPSAAAAPPPAPAGPTQFISFEGVFTAEVIDNEQEVKEILEDLREKCAESGTVLKVIVPRPPLGIKSSEVFGRGPHGKAFVEFADAAAAERCKDAIHGTLFDERTVTVQFVPQSAFDAVLGI